MIRLALFALLLSGAAALAQDVPPVNEGPNPYRVIRDWAKFEAEKRPWGGSNGVAMDKDGRTIWAVERCSLGTKPGCLGSAGNPVHHFDADGREIRSFGAGLFAWPHGLHVDKDGNIWVTDAGAPTAEEIAKTPGAKPVGGAVVKFSPDGRVLMTLGTPGVRGDPPRALTEPTNVLTDPANGDIYVSESHSDVNSPGLVGRISVFDRAGRFLRTIGRTGTGPGEFRTPHAMVWDSKGRLIVADRHNHRIQILDKQGRYIGECRQFSRVSGLGIDSKDVIYAADSESNATTHPGWKKGLRIGTLDPCRVTAFVPANTWSNNLDGAMGEGVAIDRTGAVYTAETNLAAVYKYVPN